jgi:hypothetical protein
VGKVKSRSSPFFWPGTDWQMFTAAAAGGPWYLQDWGHVAPREDTFLRGSQVTASENHPGWVHRKKNSGGNIGGPFDSVTRSATFSGGGSFEAYGSVWDGWQHRHIVYNGMVRPNIDYSNVAFPPDPASSDSELSVWGTKAIARVKPTNVFVDLSSSLAEFVREGIPKLGVHAWESITDAAREAAGHHLSLSFGFPPVVSDIYKTLGAHMSSSALIEQYLKDAGKTVRRRYDPGAQVNVSQTSVGLGPPARHFSDAVSDSFFMPTGDTILTDTVSRHRWFSGTCTYHLPLSDSMKEMSAEAVRRQGLISLDITPETLWNIAPWSWAIDWILPVGDLISNLQDHSTDGLAWTYAYVMEHSISTKTFTYTGPGSSYCGVLTLTTEHKKRIAASPFGFGVDWNGLSPFQLSIAAALGITRGK